MFEITQFAVPENDYGAETFVEIEEILYNEELEVVLVHVKDADVDDGAYEYIFTAEQRPEGIVITQQAVGCPHPVKARELEHTTVVDVLDDVEAIKFECDL